MIGRRTAAAVLVVHHRRAVRLRTRRPGHPDLARRPAGGGAPDRRRLPARRAVRPHPRETRPARRRGRAARDAVQSGGLLGRADPGDRGVGRARRGQRGEVRRGLRRRPDGDDAWCRGRSTSTGWRPWRSGVPSFQTFFDPVVARHPDDHHPAARRRVPMRWPTSRPCSWAPSAAASTSRSRTSAQSAMFGIAFPTPNPTIAVKATLPQTFMELVAKQAQRLELTADGEVTDRAKTSPRR